MTQVAGVLAFAGIACVVGGVWALCGPAWGAIAAGTGLLLLSFFLIRGITHA